MTVLNFPRAAPAC